MDENPRTEAARDTDDRTLIESAAADAAAGILPGGLGGIDLDVDRQPDSDDPEDGTRPEDKVYPGGPR